MLDKKIFSIVGTLMLSMVLGAFMSMCVTLVVGVYLTSLEYLVGWPLSVYTPEIYYRVFSMSYLVLFTIIAGCDFKTTKDE